ncbi:MAG: tetratricopeptide repeat protein [Acidovorax sp.]
MSKAKKPQKPKFSTPFLPGGLAAPSAAALPNDAQACYTLGDQWLRANRAGDALRAYDRAIALRPDYVDAYLSRCNALLRLQRPAEALANCERTLALAPTLGLAHFNHGVVLEGLGRTEEALQSYRQAVQCEPGAAHAHFNLGYLYLCMNRCADAVACMNQVLALEPQNAEALVQRGQAYLALKQDEQAFASFNQALRIKPQLAEARCQVGILLKKHKRYEEALQQLQAAWAVNPQLPGLLSEMMIVMTSMCAWDSIDDGMARIAQDVARHQSGAKAHNVLALHDDPALQLQAARNGIPASQPALGPCVPRSGTGKIRVGYYSADFHYHATTFLMAQLFELHDRECFEWFAFSFGPDQQDDMRARVRNAFDHFLDVRERSSREIAELSRSMGIDIAVDLKGFTEDARFDIFAYRCAPVQVSWLGYPGTTGADYMDYVIADKVVLPTQLQQHFSEKAVYTPHSYQCNDSHRRIADRAFTRAELGLPEAGFVFCCFNNNLKILPPTFDGWMRILHAVPGSVLWLFQDNPFVVPNLRREAQARGIAPERLVFAPRMELADHLARHRHADLFLDTLPCNAHTTASDALWAGLPVLTCAGAAFAGRVAASLLHAVGLPELVTENQADYEALAIALATDSTRVQALRDKLQAQIPTAPLFDTQRFARDIEAAYTAIHARSLQGLPPEVIHV